MLKFSVYFFIICFFLVSCRKEDMTANTSDLLLKAERYNNPGIYDEQGRYVLLRGVNLNTLGDYWQANPSIPATAPYEPDHFRLMASYGFNVVRLLVHWSKLEPERGQYNYAYISEIQQAIEDAAANGIYTLLDMHQDAYSKYIATPSDVFCESPAKGWDGAPDWATLTDGASTCMTDGRESAPAVFNAFRNLWNNTDGIQDAFIATWVELVKATAHYPMLVGYDAINEPGLGNGDFVMQGNNYSRFLKRLVSAIRQAENQANGHEHIFFFENTVTWAGQKIPYTPQFGFTNDENIVFAPHNYFEVITSDILTIEQGFELYDGLAKLYGTHSFIGEWGVFGNPTSGLPKLKRFALAEDQFFMGSAWWQWCQAPGDPHGINWEGNQYSDKSLHILEVDVSGNYTGVVNELFVNVLSRTRPIAIHGQPKALVSDPDNGTMQLKAKANDKGETIIWVPDRFGEPKITGSEIAIEKIDKVEGGYKVAVSVYDDYELNVGF